ncbi:unnamed protein product [Calicophoron daubneyi]|uniref:BZIP domain-containing protein n=1 Tax=Calicophoron daubneyi TaxID=300641 RepID=A0AAV2T606_CALDB
MQGGYVPSTVGVEDLITQGDYARFSSYDSGTVDQCYMHSTPSNPFYSNVYSFPYNNVKEECIIRPNCSASTLPPIGLCDPSLCHGTPTTMNYSSINNGFSVASAPSFPASSLESYGAVTSVVRVSEGSSVSSSVTKTRARRSNPCRDNVVSSISSASECGDSPLSLSTKSDQPATPEALVGSMSPSPNSDCKKATKRDERYLQRRLRNNLAAKRSRDNRKRREDTIALRASYLEKSNLVLQTQVLALKREICMLRNIPFDPNYRTRVEPLFMPRSSENSLQSFVLDQQVPCTSTNVRLAPDLQTTVPLPAFPVPAPFSGQSLSQGPG